MRAKALITSIFLTVNAYGSCDFNTAEFINELKDPLYLMSINIDIPDSNKWNKNLLKITVDKSNNINPKFRDKFKSKITANYKFGRCTYDARVRISGDWKDHIEFYNQQFKVSLDVKLDEGNILNSVRFKLLIPKTRNGVNEILGSLLFSELGFISPETFFTKVNVNSSGETVYLFQENAAKEMLERNLRREGPIFEGNEELLWSFRDYKTMQLESVSLSRLVNHAWAKKGITSTLISLDAYGHLQKAYLEFARHNTKQSNSFLPSTFSNYAILLLAMNGVHALYPHNMKFYFNSLNQNFEPIYYDGDLRLDLDISTGSLLRDADPNFFF